MDTYGNDGTGGAGAGRRTLGIEEELLLVDPANGEAVPKAGELLNLYVRPLEAASGPILTAEFQQEMIEVVTPPHATLAGLQQDIVAGRAIAHQAAGDVGVRVAALGTSPLPANPHPVQLRRFKAMAEEYGLTAREQLTCGCHIHVSVESPEEAVAVLDRMRIWLPVLIALSANSPFWHGQDTGYASYRAQVWNRWPSAGPLDILGGPDAYHQLVHDMVSTGVALDEGMVYFDARLSRHYPTVEIRVADVCLRPENTVLLAGIARGLVETAAREWREGTEPVSVPSALLRLAGWKASRWGLRGELLDPHTHRPAPALAVVNALLNHVRQALADMGDLQRVEEQVDRLLAEGTGAVRQMEVLHRTGDLERVVADAADCTVSASQAW
ncbi:glutamate--cysteine ligase [Arthrobacter sp. NQ7]|uniref:Putative glutamate--cysteine ligase 2 n=1 Tax=Pseudarthrobacter phenanthrenivorans TaxID=361575 RepID=A0A0B4DJ95_PSEPS|nr:MULTISPECIES: glutamate--cysteine ligase [Micrococcaceae]KIC66736.1 carboxylate--amine ligase [Pseudarthrobacter phenanthrenivorans]MDJ0455770.1 glutamate--cysteine ligase [Arthrobacter sp. NQ7]